MDRGTQASTAPAPVTVSVPSGITGLLGPNGAGKSTFMKLITGQLKPSQGSVRVLGEPIWGNHQLYRRIGFCPEQDAFYDRMTGLDWVTILSTISTPGWADSHWVIFSPSWSRSCAIVAENTFTPLKG